MLDYWLTADSLMRVGGKSGQRRERQLLTATEGDLRESAIETIPLLALKATSKGEMSGVRAHSSVR